MITRRRQLAAKVESVEGSAETLSNTYAKFLVYDPKHDVDIPEFKRDPARASLSNMSSVPGYQQAKITFKLELRGSGTKDTAPAWGILLRACGFAETIAPSTSVTYLPASSAIPSLTMALYEDGMVVKICGARGNVKLTHKTGQPIMMEFEFTGVLVSVVSGSMLSSISYESTIPPKFQSASLLMHTYAAIISSLEFDMGVKTQIREDANASGGLISAAIVGREPKGSFDPEIVTPETHDFYGKWLSGELAAFTETIGSVSGNIFTITAPKIQYVKVADADRGGIALAQTNFAVIQSSGDDELSIVQT